jgi:FtsZ-binding cell division protein ZapB
MSNLEDKVYQLDRDIHALQLNVTEIKSILPFLSTKVEVQEMRSELTSEIKEIKATVPHLATKADLEKSINTLKFLGIIIGLIAAFSPHLPSVVNYIKTVF